MQSVHYVAIPAILSAMLLCLSNPSAQAGQAKGGTSHRGGQASSHMSSKGQENTNAQWSADPERGWIRAEERHEMHEEGEPGSNPKENQGRHKGRGLKGKAKGLEKTH